VADWYYIGHYGQLGPFTREQIDDFVLDRVIMRETYVWQAGMTDWVTAERVPDLAEILMRAEPVAAVPPPSPIAVGRGPLPPPVLAPGTAAPALSRDLGASTPGFEPYPRSEFAQQRSDRSRALGGILNLVLPGVGRIYLGYSAVGVLQLLLTPCFVGYVWSFIDGILILSGTVRHDGYGRVLGE
jgi:hypothetical protein